MCRLYVESDCIFGIYSYELDRSEFSKPRSEFSKHSEYFLISYGHCSNCATCAISGKVAGSRGNRWKLLKNDLKCYI